MNREISEYPIKIIQESDPDFWDEQEKMVFFEVDTSEYNSILNNKLGSKFGSNILGISVSWNSKAINLVNKVREKIMQVYRMKITTKDKK